MPVVPSGEQESLADAGVMNDSSACMKAPVREI